MSDQLGRNPNAIGKSRPHWGQMLNIVIKNDLMEQQVGKKAEARDHYNKAIQLDPNFDEAKKRLAALN